MPKKSKKEKAAGREKHRQDLRTKKIAKKEKKKAIVSKKINKK